MVAQDYRFIHWDLERGHSLGQVNDILKDQQVLLHSRTSAGLKEFYAIAEKIKQSVPGYEPKLWVTTGK